MKKLIIILGMILLSYSISAQQVTQYEYWTDGSFTTRTSVNLASPATDVTVSFQYNTAALSNGLHSLNTRFRDSNGKWSCVQTDYFFKTAAIGAGTNTITATEYWFDADFTGRTAETITSPVNDAIISKSLDVSALSNGLHSVNFRFQDASGQWNCVQTDYFFKTTSIGAGTNTIIATEFWFDTDFTGRTAETLSSPANDVTITKSLDVSALSNGLHSLNFRFQDAAGQWSCVQTDYFFKTASIGAGTNTITTTEYWFDTDFTGRTAETISSPANDVTINKSLNVTAMSNGLHALNFRFQDAIGQWSCVQTDYFLKTPTLGMDSNIMVSFEYWIDTAFAARISGVTSPLSNLTLIDSVAVAYLTEGYHILNYRFSDALGQWSCVQSDTFKRCPVYYAAPVISGNTSICAGQTISLSAVSNDVSTTGYYWKGPNNYSLSGSTITITNATAVRSGTYYCTAIRGTSMCDSSIIGQLEVVVNPLPVGVISGLSSVCNGDSTYLVASGGTSYLWNSGSINDSLLIAPTVGATYYVTVTSDSGCVATKSKYVSIKAKPNVIISPASATICQGTSQILTASGASTYVWNDGTITGSDTLSPPATTIYTVTGTAVNGCKKSATATININPFPASAGLISGADNVCPGQNGVTYTVPAIADATSYVWTLPSGVIGTSISNSITVDFGISAVSGTISVYGTNACGDGLASSYPFIVDALPEPAAAISGLGNVCPGQNSVTYIVPAIADATSYDWTFPAGITGTSVSNSITVDFGISAASGTISVYGKNACGDGVASSFPVIVNALPESAGVISGLGNVCPGQSAVTYTVPAIDDATSYTWNLPADVTGTSTTNSITVDFAITAASGNISVYGTNACGDGTASSYPFIVNTIPETAGAILGLTSVCQGQNSVTYTVPAIAGATSYVWTLPGNTTGTSNTTSISVDFDGLFLSGDISVKGINDCGEGSMASLQISAINSLPLPASNISGLQILCQGQNAVTYTVPIIAGAGSYVWTLPGGTTGTSSTNSITVDYGIAAVSGAISVYGTNACGDGSASSLSITVDPLPAGAGAISGETSVCQDAGAIIFTVPSIDYATSYLWTLPAGATGASTTNSIAVDLSTAASGDVTVIGNNSCGPGAGSVLAITVTPKPATPNISVVAITLHSDVASGNQWYDMTGAISGATSQDYTPVGNGNYFVIVEINGCSSDPSDTISITTVGVSHDVESLELVSVFPNPFRNQLILENISQKSVISFELVNMIGDHVFSGELTDRLLLLTEALSDGVYFLKLESNNRVYIKKLVKN